MLVNTVRYFDHPYKLHRLYAWPEYYFTYEGFGWVQPMPIDRLRTHMMILGVLSLNIAAGFYYHISTTLFFLGFTYIFLLDQTHYLNHYYLISLMSLVLIFLPLNRHNSFDARFKLVRRSRTVPVWTVWVLRAMVGLPYFYGGIAKLNWDWLRGEPMRMWLKKV
eukprot:CAMPEP_0170191216 /NCGR_PEP_ID=MMETSP0040_2-20121228/51162_1 /TAXON_ID=641309 /ORGANISM="Lotharella oceanica, Strain CCMP622" /LENGTH=163 /DNA_ID=CAMNT_0010439247 /DNA_START=194 /DNA_END=681 /DNA_ORIENTATION=+